MAGRRTAERGQAAVELALCLPILVLFLGGIFVFGQALLEMQQLSHAASEGARVNATYANASDCESRVSTAVRNAADIGGSRLDGGTFSITDGCGATSGSVTVTVSYPMQISLGFSSIDRNVTRSRTMRVMT